MRKTIQNLIAALTKAEKANAALAEAVKAARAAKVTKTELRDALKRHFKYDTTEGAARRALDTRISRMLKRAGYETEKSGGRASFKVSDRLFNETITFLRRNNVLDVDMKAALKAIADSIVVVEEKK